jgi:hypothetical protein
MASFSRTAGWHPFLGMTPRSVAGAFGLRLLVFGLPLLLVWAGLECWTARMPDSYSIKYRNLAAHADEIDTLILGSSVADYGIAPQYLPGTAYNLANMAESLYYDDRLGTAVLPELPRLRRVIIAVNDLSLFYDMRYEKLREYEYYRQWHIPPPSWGDRLDLRMWSAVALRSPSVAVQSFYHALLRASHGKGLKPPQPWPAIASDGWSPRADTDPARLEPAVVDRKLLYEELSMHRSDEANNLESLSHLLSLLRSHHIEVVLVVPPVWPQYAARMNKEFWDRAQRDLRGLAAKYDARYFSFLVSPQLGPADFLDADHLSRQGAIHFTQMLTAAIEQGELPKASMAGAPRDASVAGASRDASLAGASRDASLAGASRDASMAGAPRDASLAGASRDASMAGAPRDASMAGAPRDAAMAGAPRASR